MTRVEELKAEIYKNERLSDLGMEIYKSNGKGNFLRNATFFHNEADKLKKVLEEEYNVIL